MKALSKATQAEKSNVEHQILKNTKANCNRQVTFPTLSKLKNLIQQVSSLSFYSLFFMNSTQFPFSTNTQRPYPRSSVICTFASLKFNFHVAEPFPL